MITSYFNFHLSSIDLDRPFKHHSHFTRVVSSRNLYSNNHRGMGRLSSVCTLSRPSNHRDSMHNEESVSLIAIG